MTVEPFPEWRIRHVGKGIQIDLYKRVEGEYPFTQVKPDDGEFRNLL